MTHKEYNGWYNYETWLVNLWFDNDGTSEYYRELVQDETVEDSYDLAQVMKSDLEENTPETTGLFADLLNSALSEVNFEEIADHYFN